MKIANIVSDDKFIDSVIKVQDLFSKNCKHDYIIVKHNNLNKKFTYIKNSQRITIVQVLCFLNFINKERYDAIFLHNLYALPLYIIQWIPKKIKVFWFSWGSDIYTPIGFSDPLIPIILYKEKTFEILTKINDYQKQKSPHVFVSKILSTLFLKKAILRIDYYSGVLPYEFDLLQKNIFFKAKRVSYHYVNPQESKKGSVFRKCEGINIMLGNSGDPANNHLDAIEKIFSIDLKNRKIIVPLSYGDKSYTKFLQEHLLKSNKNIMILKDFMPRNEYKRIVNSCGISIFFHERQAAMGNIILSLRNGNKVFMSETNLAYKFLKEYGFIIFSFQRDFNQKNVDMFLSENEQYTNWELSYSLFNLQTQKKDLADIYSLIKSF